MNRYLDGSHDLYPALLRIQGEHVLRDGESTHQNLYQAVSRDLMLRLITLGPLRCVSGGGWD